MGPARDGQPPYWGDRAVPGPSGRVAPGSGGERHRLHAAARAAARLAAHS